MSQDREKNLALFIDFDNVALGARDARQRFEIKLLLERLLEKGKIIIKKAYADWHYYKEHLSPLHEAAIELIEIPMPRISGKNSADIKLVVDAMDLCYSKEHLDTFVIVSGDSDFSPLVSKLRENNKRVIGVGMKNSSSRLLIGNCDEFIFYDDIFRQKSGQPTRQVANLASDKRELFDFLVATSESLLQESRGSLYSSLIKDTMKRKQPEFNERAYGYATFGDLLEEARKLGLLVVERDARAGGTWVVQGIGKGVAAEKSPEEQPVGSNGRPSRRRRRGGRGSDRKSQETVTGAADSPAGEQAPKTQGSVPVSTPKPRQAAPTPSGDRAGTSESRATAPARKKVAKKAPAKKAPAKKAVAKKAPAKKTPAKTAPTKTAPTKKAVAKKAPARTAATKKTVAKKAPAKKTATKKTGSK